MEVSEEAPILARGNAASHRANILVVEDSPTQLQQLAHLLTENGYHVIGAANGAEALEHIRAATPDLIISDLLMPVMDGYQMCNILKNNEKWADIPVMLLTMLSAAEDVILGLNAGADYYITKPFANNYLLARVNSVLKTRTHSETLEAGDADGMEVIVADRSYTVRAGRRQMLNLLLSTYENAVQRNNELLVIQNELRTANARLREQHARLQGANEQLSALATTDGLTGLKNHRAFQEKLDLECKLATRYERPLSLLMIDVDHFKQYNDTHGHPAGDEILRAVAETIQHQARSVDFAARYGGEEFAVILPNTGVDSTRVFAERLRKAIQAAPWSQEKVTISVGGATLTPEIADSNTLISLADSALYLSKHRGRNVFTHIEDPENRRVTSAS